MPRNRSDLHTEKAMNKLNKSREYTFICYDGSMPPGDPRVLGLIRSSAMKHTAAIRKRGGGYTKHNVGQLPIQFMPPYTRSEDEASFAVDTTDTLHGRDNDTPGHGAQYSSPSTSFNISTPPTDAILTAMSTNPYLSKLAMPMTVLDLGLMKLLSSRTDCICFGHALSKMPLYLESRRLISFVANRYGQIDTITNATNSLVSRLGHIAQKHIRWKSESDDTSLRYYAKALRSLQDAIDDDERRMMPETLCSVQLLGIFELLNGHTSIDKWVEHVRGAGRLIELRGPGRFRTAFELSLFMTHAGPIITEAFLNGKTCFLHEERWQNVIHAAIYRDPLVPPSQKHLVTKMWCIFSSGPNFFKEVQDMILSSSLTSNEKKENVIRRIVREQERLKDWSASAEKQCSGISGQGVLDTSSDQDTFVQSYNSRCIWAKGSIVGRTLQGAYVLSCLIQMRLLYALSPVRFQGLENSCQTLAREVFPETEYSTITEDERLMGGFFMSEVVWMAKAVMNTRDIWRHDCNVTESERNRDPTRMIDGWKFKAWCKAAGRKIA